MKVVHISLSNDGGAGIAAYRLHKAQIKLGIDSAMLVLHSKNNDPTVKIIDSTATPCLTTGPGTSPHYHVYEQHRNDLMKRHPLRQKPFDMFNDNSSEVVLEDIVLINEADIINLHWTVGVVDIARMGHIFKGKIVVWTLHAMSEFTGGCCCAYDCKKYITECANCPQLGSNTFDYAKHIFKQKLHGMQALDVTAVSPSGWLAQCAAESAIFSGKAVQHIPNGIPVDIFKPMECAGTRKILNIAPESFVVLFGAFDASDERKGFQHLISALNTLPEEMLDRITVVGFGASSKEALESLPCEVRTLGTICSEENLALIYSMADVFVVPSMADNLPNTILESLACGTPVVAFSVGGIPDIVEHMVNGYLATPFHPQEISDGIVWCRNNKTLIMQKTCASTVRFRFNSRVQAMQYVSLYQNLLKASVCLQKY